MDELQEIIEQFPDLTRDELIDLRDFYNERIAIITQDNPYGPYPRKDVVNLAVDRTRNYLLRQRGLQ